MKLKRRRWKCYCCKGEIKQTETIQNTPNKKEETENYRSVNTEKKEMNSRENSNREMESMQ